MTKTCRFWITFLLCSLALSCGETDGTVLSKRTPERLCGGLIGAMCAEGEYCDYGPACGFADITGVCKPQPTSCSRRPRALVCGCDGHTYWSKCYAARSGQSIVYEGRCDRECPLTGVECTSDCPDSGMSHAGAPCERGDFNPMTCECEPVDLPTCVPSEVPGETCDDMADNDCDGRIDCNDADCDCPPTPRPPTCGGMDGGICPEGMHCVNAVGSCRTPDRAGVCRLDFDVCPEIVSEPVCGCNGETYESSCAAELAGVTIAYAGECSTSPDK